MYPSAFSPASAHPLPPISLPFPIASLPLSLICGIFIFYICISAFQPSTINYCFPEHRMFLTKSQLHPILSNSLTSFCLAGVVVFAGGGVLFCYWEILGIISFNVRWMLVKLCKEASAPKSMYNSVTSIRDIPELNYKLRFQCQTCWHGKTSSQILWSII